MRTLKEIVEENKEKMQCNCDLDNWQPQTDTGHSWVCRIDKASRWQWREERNQ